MVFFPTHKNVPKECSIIEVKIYVLLTKLLQRLMDL
jgi:hypothetical protein